MNRRVEVMWLSGALLLALAAPAVWGASPTPKTGGILNAMHREDPPSLSVHEEATISTVWPMMPGYAPSWGGATTSTPCGRT